MKPTSPLKTLRARLRTPRGMVLLVVLVLLAAISVAVFSQLDVLQAESTMTSRREQEMLARAAADACMERATALVSTFITSSLPSDPTKRPADFDLLLDPVPASTSPPDEFIPSGWSAVNISSGGGAQSRFGFQPISVGADTNAGCLIRFDDNNDDGYATNTHGTSVATTTNTPDSSPAPEGPNSSSCGCDCRPDSGGKECTWNIGSAVCALGQPLILANLVGCDLDPADCDDNECEFDCSNAASCPAGGAGQDVRTRDRDRAIFITAIGIYPVQSGTVPADAYAKAHSRVTLKRFFQTGGVSAITSGGQVTLGSNSEICGSGGVNADSLDITGSNTCSCGSTALENPLPSGDTLADCSANTSVCPAGAPPCIPADISTNVPAPTVPPPALPETHWRNLKPVEATDLGDDDLCFFYFRESKPLPAVLPPEPVITAPMAFVWDRFSPGCNVNASTFGGTEVDRLPRTCDVYVQAATTTCSCNNVDADGDTAVDDMVWDTGADSACNPAPSFTCASTSTSGTVVTGFNCSNLTCPAPRTAVDAAPQPSGCSGPSTCWKPLAVFDGNPTRAGNVPAAWEQVRGTTTEHFSPRDSGTQFQTTMSRNQSQIFANGFDSWLAYCKGDTTLNTTKLTPTTGAFNFTAGTPGTWNLDNHNNLNMPRPAVAAFEGNVTLGNNVGKATSGFNSPPLNWSILAQNNFDGGNGDNRLCCATCEPAACAIFDNLSNVIGSSACITDGSPMDVHPLIFNEAGTNGGGFYQIEGGPIAELPPVPEPPPYAMLPAVVRAGANCRGENKLDFYGSMQCGSIYMKNSMCVVGGLVAFGPAAATGCGTACPGTYLICMGNNTELVGHMRADNDTTAVAGTAGAGACFGNRAQIVGNIWMDGNITFERDMTLAGNIAVTGNVTINNNAQIVNSTEWNGVTGAGISASGSRSITVVETNW